MGEILTQAEIDALLSALDSGELDPVDMKQETGTQRVKLYDFKRPEKFTKEHLRTLQMIHENFARTLSTFLAATLRSLVEIKVASVQQLSYYEFTRSLPVMTFLSLFDVPEWEGRAMVECSSNLIFTMIDKLLGGPGIPPAETRPLTDIEQGIVQQILRQAAPLGQDAWNTVSHVNFRLESLETNPLFTQIVSPNETVALVTCSAKLGNVEGMINICLPHVALEKVLDKLTTRSWYAGQTREQSVETNRWVEQRLNSVSLPIRVELGSSEITLNDLLSLQVGDCIQLGQSAEGMLDVFVGPYCKFKARPGQSRRHLGVQIVSVVAGGEDNGT